MAEWSRRNVKDSRLAGIEPRPGSNPSTCHQNRTQRVHKANLGGTPTAGKMLNVDSLGLLSKPLSQRTGKNGRIGTWGQKVPDIPGGPQKLGTTGRNLRKPKAPCNPLSANSKGDVAMYAGQNAELGRTYSSCIDCLVCDRMGNKK